MKLNINEKYLSVSCGLHYVSNVYTGIVTTFKLDKKGNRISPMTRSSPGYVGSFTNDDIGENGCQSVIAGLKRINPLFTFARINRNIGARFNASGSPHANGWSAKQYSTHFDLYDRSVDYDYNRNGDCKITRLI